MTLARRFSGLILLMWSVLLLGSMPAAADLKYDYQEAPNGDTRLVISGMMSVDDDLRVLEDYLRRTVISYVTFDSKGGNPRAAMDIGQMLRRYGMPTRQINGLRCLSACVYAFLGGVERRATPLSLGVHQVHLLGKTGFSREGDLEYIQLVIADLYRYLEFMNLNKDILKIALLTLPKNVHLFKAEELVELGIAEVITAPENQVFASYGNSGGPVPLPGTKPR